MIFRHTRLFITLKVLLLLAVLTLSAYLIVKGLNTYLLLLGPLALFLCIDFYKYQLKQINEVAQFTESVKYRDFSRHFDATTSRGMTQELRKNFNEINAMFRHISREKETQYQYLQKILELVDTGILSYEERSHTVLWMNESLKKMLMMPYLKTLQSLAMRDRGLYKEIVSLKTGSRKLSTINLPNSSSKVLLSATSFSVEGKSYKLIAFQNVSEALEETESKAWQQLLRVLTHEIMNSVAPISSLAETLKTRMQNQAGKGSTSSADDLETGIDTIRRRSEGLLKFAETYRNLSKITTLNLERVYVRDIFENILRLMQPSLLQKNIEIDTVLKDTDIQFDADINLVEQVLINLIVNAVEAVKDQDDAVIILSAYHDNNGRVVLRIEDNGTGIPHELLERIFIPFFSTKKQGSGIGLSLCKQIMMLHKGNIQVLSEEGQGTSFLLKF